MVNIQHDYKQMHVIELTLEIRSEIDIDSHDIHLKLATAVQGHNAQMQDTCPWLGIYLTCQWGGGVSVSPSGNSSHLFLCLQQLLWMTFPQMIVTSTLHRR